MTRRAGLLLAALLATLAARGLAAELNGTVEVPLVPVRVGFWGEDSPPYNFRANGSDGEWDGFMADLRDRVCAAANLDCEWVPLPTIADFIPSLQNGSVDILAEALSVTDDRKQQIDFVYPGFFSAGVALYTSPEMGLILGASGGWDSLAGTPICLFDGYYANGKLVNEYKIEPVIVATVDEAAAAVAADKCTAFAFDTGRPEMAKAGLPQAATVQEVLSTPLALAVRQGDDGLRHRLSAAVVELMQDGNNSEMLQLQKEWLNDNGVLSNENLYHVVEAITNFEGGGKERN